MYDCHIMIVAVSAYKNHSHIDGNTGARAVRDPYNRNSLHCSLAGWDDIGYSFLVGEDGRVYEGRGWEHRPAQAREHNDYSYGISIMGDFMESLPLVQALNGVNDIIACGVQEASGCAHT